MTVPSGRAAGCGRRARAGLRLARLTTRLQACGSGGWRGTLCRA